MWLQGQKIWTNGPLICLMAGGLGTLNRKPLATGHLSPQPSLPTTKKATSMYGLMAPPYMSGESLDKAMTKALAQADGEISLDTAHGVSLDKAHGISLDKVPGRGGAVGPAILAGASTTTSMVEGSRHLLPQDHLTLRGTSPGGLAPNRKENRRGGWRGKASQCLLSSSLKSRA